MGAGGDLRRAWKWPRATRRRRQTWAHRCAQEMPPRVPPKVPQKLESDRVAATRSFSFGEGSPEARTVCRLPGLRLFWARVSVCGKDNTQKIQVKEFSIA